MSSTYGNEYLKGYDERCDLLVPGDQAATLQFSIELFIKIANEALKEKGFFAVALSGGNTPKAIFKGLTSIENRNRIDWRRVLLFWSDERCVPKDHPESNYKMAMDAGLATVPISKENIFPFPSEGDLEKNALEYEELIRRKIPTGQFDLVMLGMGDDGHIASLFPKTHGLHAEGRLVIPNFLPDKNCWRMTLTFECINAARHIIIYVLGKSKATTLKHVLNGTFEPDTLPAQRVGTPQHRALWIADTEAYSSSCREIIDNQK